MDLSQLEQVLTSTRQAVDDFSSKKIQALDQIKTGYSENLQVIDVHDGITKLKKREQKEADQLSALKQVQSQCVMEKENISKGIAFAASRAPLTFLQTLLKQPRKRFTGKRSSSLPRKSTRSSSG